MWDFDYPLTHHRIELNMGRAQTPETRAKISASLKKIPGGRRTQYVTIRCQCCDHSFETSPGKAKRRIFCSRKCSITFRNLNGLAQRAGLASVAAQTSSRRSKNEILFAELCSTRFDILTNVPMFEGWDADIVIPSLKIAVLWNGAWHYKQISKSSSLAQIQTRDKIKLDVIVRCGYVPYVIKDMGKYNPCFVKEKFEEFIAGWSNPVTCEAHNLEILFKSGTRNHLTK
jgi:hypothetical protein